MENAPLVAQAIADYTGKTKGELKEMSSEGTITADIIKKAMFASAEQIESRFSQMPKTFGDYWTLFKNKTTQAFAPIIKQINDIINTPGFEEFFSNLVIFVQLSAEAIGWLINSMIWLYQILEPFAPLILGIATALITYKIYTMLAAAGQWILNAAMSANPSAIMYAAIMAIIVVLIYFYITNEQVAYAILYLWDSLKIGAMALCLGAQGAFFLMILAAQYLLLGMIGVCFAILTAWYSFQTGIEAVGVGILYIFQGLYNGVVSIVNGIIDVLNKIPGVSIDAAEYTNFANDALDGMIDNVVNRNEDLQSMLDNMNDVNNSINENKAKFASELSKSATNIQNKTIEMNSTRDDRVANRNGWINDLQNKINGSLDIGNSLNSKAIPVKTAGGSVDNVGNVDDVNISDEDLKYIKDFAEQDFINKFTTATLAPNVNISFGDIHENADAEKIKDRIKEILEEEIAEVAEGVYD